MVVVSTNLNSQLIAERSTEYCLPPPSTSSPGTVEPRTKSSGVLQSLILRLEKDILLSEPAQLRERLEALDRLDAYIPGVPQEAVGFDQELSRRAEAIRKRFERMNADLFEGIRHDIQRGRRPHDLLRWVSSPLPSEPLHASANGMGYDFIDELITGVFRLEEPDDEHISRDPEKLFYQPTPARHIFSLIHLTGLTPNDVFVDLGSGLGHVPMMVSICTASRSIGVELQAPYVQRAQQCALGLNLDRVTFIHSDARKADLSEGTIFYLYTPFMGSVLSAVLARLRNEAAARQIRIACHGPCTPVVASEPWLVATTPPDPHAITVFRSRT